MAKPSMQVAIIGGGAAGFFAAISAKIHHPNASVTIFEKSDKLLAKVRVSGGGRCNVTNGQQSLKLLTAGYPRGSKLMKSLLARFSNRDTMNWFEKRNTPLYTQDDGRVFPKSNNSESIISCLLQDAQKLGIRIKLKSAISRIEPGKRIQLYFGKELESISFDKVVVASGGSPKLDGFGWLKACGHKIESPVPSLFTFNMPKSDIRQYMGLSVDNVLVSIEGSKLKSKGPLLVTHWGMSGPAILLLSAFGARYLAEKAYSFNILVNWTGIANQSEVWAALQLICKTSAAKQAQNLRPFNLPERLWIRILQLAEIALDRRAGDLGPKHFNKLSSLLTQERFNVEGKTTFKDEFVTCGGLSLESVKPNTLESQHVPGLYFAGEVLDIDGITGGYNFQAAWTTGYIAGQLI